MSKTRRTATGPGPLVGYVRVSTDEQAGSGLGLAAQRSAIRQHAEYNARPLGTIYEDSASGRSLDKRPGLADALAELHAGRASGLCVAKLDRLSRSLLDFATLMQRSQKERWVLVALDLGVDTSTPQGELMASVMATFAQFERRLIGARTKDALAELKAQGVKLGAPRTLPTEVEQRIQTLRASGLTVRAIAETLNTEGVPTATGRGAWQPGTVNHVLKRYG